MFKVGRLVIDDVVGRERVSGIVDVVAPDECRLECSVRLTGCVDIGSSSKTAVFLRFLENKTSFQFFLEVDVEHR